MSPRLYFPALAGIFTAALVIRIGLASAFVGLGSPPDAVGQIDQLDYELYAYRMSEGLGYTDDENIPTANRTPGTSLAIWPVYEIFGRNFAAARVWFCLLSAATCLAVAWAGTQSFGPIAGLLAGLMLAVYPNHAYYTLHFSSEVPFALLLVLATGATVRAMRRDAPVWISLAAGLLWGASALVRPNILLVVPLLFIAVLLAKDLRRVRFQRTVLIALVAAAILAPWVVRNRVVMGQFMLSSVGAHTFWGAHNEQTLARAPGGWLETSKVANEQQPLTGGELNRMAQARRYGLEFLRENAESLPYLTAMKMYRFWTPFEDTPNQAVRWAFALAWIGAFPLLVVGVARGLREQSRETHLLLLPLWATIATALIFYGSVRFRDSVAPIYLVFAAVGLLVVVAALASAVQKRRQLTSLPGTSSLPSEAVQKAL